MSFPVQAPQPSYSGSFIPEIWSKKLIDKFYDATVLSAIANTDYEGEIREKGDMVKIRTIPSLVINNYVSGQTLVNQHPTSNIVELLIDKGKYWSTICDDVQKVQMDINAINLWAQDASEQMKITIDTDVLGNIIPDFSVDNVGATAGRLSNNIDLGVTGTPLSLTKVNMIDTIIDLGQVLDEQNVPEQGRFIVMPFWATALLKKSDLRDASLTGDGTSVMRNGRVGMIDRFTIYNSNNLPHATEGAAQAYYIIAGTKTGLTFASQLTKTETLRAETTFGDIMRGLQVFGYKVVNPVCLTAAYAVKG